MRRSQSSETNRLPVHLSVRCEHSARTNRVMASNNTAADLDALCSQPTQPVFIVYSLFLVLIMLATLFGNVLVITAVYLSRRLRRMTNFFIISLAVSDLLVAVGHLPLRIDQSIHNQNWCFDKAPGVVTTCAYWIAMDTVFSSASICNLVIISIDRFLAITKPFEYQSRMRKRVGFSLIAFVWVYAMLWGVLSLVDWTGDSTPTKPHISVGISKTGERTCGKNDKVYYTTAMAVAFFLPLLIVIVTYSCVFRVAFAQAKAVASLDPNKGKRHILRELKATKTIAVVIGVFIVCWLPGFILIVLSLWCESCFIPFVKNKDLSLAVRIIFVYVLPVMNSSLNPLIYTLFNKEFRSAFSRMLCSSRRTSRGGEAEDFSVTEQNTRVSVQHSRNSERKSWISLNGRDKRPS